MLALDNPRWARLQGNFSSGDEVAKLLERAFNEVPFETWYDDLFQELCHQYSVSEAAYAALPHLVVLAERSPEHLNPLLVLIGSCCASAQGPEAPTIPDGLEAGWYSAAEAALPLVCKALTMSGLEKSEFRYLVFTAAALQGHPALAYYIEGYDVEIECPNCGLLIDPAGH